MSAPLNLGALARETGVRRARIITSLLPWLWRFGGVASCAGLTGAWIQPASFLLLAILGASAGLLYAVTVVTPLLSSPAGLYLRPLVARVKTLAGSIAARRRGGLPITP